MDRLNEHHKGKERTQFVRSFKAREVTFLWYGGTRGWHMEMDYTGWEVSKLMGSAMSRGLLEAPDTL